MKPITLLFLLVLGGTAVSVTAAEKEKTKTPEEKLKEEIEKKMNDQGALWLPKIGNVHLAPELIDDDKPLPKLVGTFDELQGGSFQLMVYERNTIAALKGLDGKQANLMGKLIDGGDKGMIWMTNGPVPGNAGAGMARRKRGGL